MAVFRKRTHTPTPKKKDIPADQNALLALAFREADRAVAEVFGRPPLYLREGGSVPIIGDIRREPDWTP